MEGINLDLLKSFRSDFEKNKINKIAKMSVNKNGVFNSSFNSDALRGLDPIFSDEVKEIGSITNQKQSGRCWMFSGLNVLRPYVLKSLKVKDFEFSENYLMFFDKLEKTNYALIKAIETAKEEFDSRIILYVITSAGQQDGGYFHFFTNLVKKYGLCPKTAMKETISSSASAEMNEVLANLVAKDVAKLRDDASKGISKDELLKEKDEMLKEVYQVLAISLGEPPVEFTYEYHEDNKKDDKDAKKDDTKQEEKKEENDFKRIHSAPLDFFKKYVNVNLDDFVVLTNWGVKKYPLNQTYVCSFINNVSDAKDGIMLQVDLDEMKEAAIKSIKGGDAMWFACDVTANSFRKDGLLVKEVLDIDSLFNINTKSSKGDRLVYFATQCNHAMTLAGVNLVDNKPNRWKVMNSWGEDVGFKGFYIMSDKWFDEYVYEVVVLKKYLNEKLLEALKKEPIVLPPWSTVNKMAL